ncbi:MAG: hypothetical protein PHC89_00460 [Candidatus Pacebacteria bacterium]|nr:hypothetical protein [Candidatus Paceibacterota bacterium]
MDKKTKKFIFIFVITLLIIPQVTFAVWWNPTTWKIWNIFMRQHTETQISETVKVPPTEESITIEQEDSEPFPSENQTTPTIQTSLVQVPTVVIPSQQQDLRECNGITYTNTCSIGTEFFCPSSGQAYCTSPLINSINQQREGGNDLLKQQEERKNSVECREATKQLENIKEKKKKTQDKSDSYYKAYKKDNSDSAFLKYMEYSREALTLSSEESLLFSEQGKACDGVFTIPSIPKTYNTNCYTNGYGLISCTTY